MNKSTKIRRLFTEAADADIAAYTGISVSDFASLERKQRSLRGADAQTISALCRMYDDRHRATQISDRAMAIISKSPDIALVKAVDQATRTWELEHAEVVPARVPTATGEQESAALLTGGDRLAYHRGQVGKLCGRTQCAVAGRGSDVPAVWCYRGGRQPLQFMEFCSDGGALPADWSAKRKYDCI